mmetsp:Transcript_34733/g.83939  ORF Transcript_34733/g.83939 Transcript_34733/m.83939 type:complete len:548 (-) Transcript_34733:194-1837(-)
MAGAERDSVKYLKEHVGPILAKALAAMAVANPPDAIDYLGQWLKVYVEREEAKVLQEQEAAALKKAREELKIETDRIQQIEAEIASKKDAQDKAVQELLEKLEAEPESFEDSMWKTVVEAAKTYVGATGAYIGLVDEEGIMVGDDKKKALRYTYASEGEESMLNEVLVQGTGVTWAALEPQAAAEGEGEEGAADAECKPKYVPDVTDEDAVHFFRLTRLGSFAAMPLIYNTSLSEDAISALRDAKVAHEKERLRREAEPLAEGQEREPMPEMETPPMKTQQVRMVLCIDTLGQNSKLPPEKLAVLEKLCKTASRCKQQSEEAAVRNSADVLVGIEMQREETAQEMQAALAQEEQEMDEELKQALDSLGDDTVADKQKAVRLEKAFKMHGKMLEKMQQHFLALKPLSLVAAPILQVLTASAYFMGYTPDHVMGRGNKPGWEMVKKLLDADFFAKAVALNVRGPRLNLLPEQKLANIEAMLADLDAQKAALALPALEAMFMWLEKGIECRKHDVTMRKAELEEAERRRAEEAETEPQPIDFTGVDDDME